MIINAIASEPSLTCECHPPQCLSACWSNRRSAPSPPQGVPAPWHVPAGVSSATLELRLAFLKKGTSGLARIGGCRVDRLRATLIFERLWQGYVE